MLCKNLDSSFTKFDSGIHDLAVCKTLCKYINVCFVYYLHILDSRRCPGEKGWTFRKSKMSLWVHVTFHSKCSSFFTQRFLYIFGCCGPWCGRTCCASPITQGNFCKNYYLKIESIDNLFKFKSQYLKKFICPVSTWHAIVYQIISLKFSKSIFLAGYVSSSIHPYHNCAI